jgi:glutamate carboxypeptidase
MIQGMENLLQHFKIRTPEILADLEKLVRLESPSKDVAAINRVQDALVAMLDGLGSITRHSTDLGDVLHFTMPGKSPERVVYLAHADTVYAHGFWANIWRIEGDQAFGPGVYDMKGGIVQAIHAMQALKELGLEPASTIELLVTPDEEIESRAGRPFIEKLATGAKAVIVLEPPHLNGDLKVARKGVGGYRVTIHGKAAAHFITEVVKLQDIPKGTTMGPNVIHGGTVMNVVADEVYLEVDLRVWSQEEADRVDAAIKSIQPLEGTTYTILDGLNRPPMEPSDGTWKLLETGQKIARGLGFDPGAARVGGGSDGNFTAKLAPTIDGFGIHGKNAHQRELEYITISDIAPRTALVAGMMLEV